MAGISISNVESSPERRPELALRLNEELLLLALDDERGLVSGASIEGLRQGLAYAILAELRLSGRISFAGRGPDSQLELNSTESTGDQLLDGCLGCLAEMFSEAADPSLAVCCKRLIERCELSRESARSLCSRGVLSEETGRYWLVFSRERYPEKDPRAEVEMVRRLRNAVFTDLSEVDLRTSLLVAFANQSLLLGKAFDLEALKGRERRLERLRSGDFLARAVAKSEEGQVYSELMSLLV